MLGEQIRQRLHAGEPVYGTHLTHTTNSPVAAFIAGTGMDYVFLCTEHMPLDRTEASALCCLLTAKGISPAVRLSHPSAAEAGMALDAGAQGIVAPYVETVEAVREIVGAVHCRPIKGKFLRDLQSGLREPSKKTSDFLQRFNRHHWVMIGIESIEGYENLDAILAERGVDGIFIGPHDLTVSLEEPEDWSHPEFHRILDDIVVRCRAAGVGVGVHATPGVFSLERVRQLMHLGMNWILDGSDAGQAVAAFTERRKALGLQPSVSQAIDPLDVPQSCGVIKAKDH